MKQRLERGLTLPWNTVRPEEPEEQKPGEETEVELTEADAECFYIPDFWDRRGT